MSTATATYTRYEMLRTFRSTRFFVFSLAFPIILFFLVAGPEPRPGAGRHLVPALLHDRHGGVGLDDGGDGQRRPHRRRALGRLEPPAAHHAAADRASTSGPRS